jgi:peptidoglycan/LPS O-acetylase OafA/YrhL
MPASGVDLFFCISGFVVSKAYLDFFDQHAARGQFALAFRTFWIRRAFRLWPTSWLWVLVGLLCSIAFNSTGVFGTPWDSVRSFAVVVTMCGNIANQFGAWLYPNDIYWSLALEEQFYFAFPFFLLLVAATWRWRVLLLLVGFQFFLDRNLNMFFTPRLTAFLWAIRLDAIMWGVLIFLFSRTDWWRRAEPTVLASAPARIVVNMVLLYALVAIPVKLVQERISMGLVAIVAAALVLMASYERGYTVRQPQLSRLFAWVGARSYAIYVIHITAFRLTIEAWTRHAATRGLALGPPDAIAIVVTATALMFALVELNYRLVEIPLRNRGKAIAGRASA